MEINSVVERNTGKKENPIKEVDMKDVTCFKEISSRMNFFFFTF